MAAVHLMIIINNTIIDSFNESGSLCQELFILFACELNGL